MGENLIPLAKWLITLGLVIAAIGLTLLFIPKIPIIGEHIGRLPGDIYIKKDGFSFYFPFTTGIITGIIISLILYLLRR